MENLTITARPNGLVDLSFKLRGHEFVATFSNWRQLIVTLVRWSDDKGRDFTISDACVVMWHLGRIFENERVLSQIPETNGHWEPL